MYSFLAGHCPGRGPGPGTAWPGAASGAPAKALAALTALASSGQGTRTRVGRAAARRQASARDGASTEASTRACAMPNSKTARPRRRGRPAARRGSCVKYARGGVGKGPASLSRGAVGADTSLSAATSRGSAWRQRTTQIKLAVVAAAGGGAGSGSAGKPEDGFLPLILEDTSVRPTAAGVAPSRSSAGKPVDISRCSTELPGGAGAGLNDVAILVCSAFRRTGPAQTYPASANTRRAGRYPHHTLPAQTIHFPAGRETFSSDSSGVGQQAEIQCSPAEGYTLAQFSKALGAWVPRPRREAGDRGRRRDNRQGYSAPPPFCASSAGPVCILMHHLTPAMQRDSTGRGAPGCESGRSTTPRRAEASSLKST